MTRLVPMTQDHFAWAMDETVYPTRDGTLPSFDGLRQPPGRFETIARLGWLKRNVGIVPMTIGMGCWLIVDGDEVVGTIGFNQLPYNGEAEIVFSIAPSRRRRGYATRAVALAAAEAATLSQDLIAEVEDGNPGANAVLKKNGFVIYGAGASKAGAALTLWRRVIPAP